MELPVLNNYLYKKITMINGTERIDHAKSHFIPAAVIGALRRFVS